MISVVIIANNEEQNIGRCLDSVKGIASEIIVLDSGSSDGTQSIVEAAGGKWIPQEWLGYGAQKNKANTFASNPYILSLDADEALSPELRASILAILPTLDGVYQFNRLTNYAGAWIRHGGWYPDTKIRLFRSEEASWDNAHVHERLVIHPGVPIHTLSGDLLHYSYYSSAEHRERTEQYARLQAEALYAAGVHPTFWHFGIKPAFTFFKRYILQSGWRDGPAGLSIAIISAWGTRRRYELLQELRA